MESLVSIFVIISVLSGTLFSCITPSEKFLRYIRLSFGILLCSIAFSGIWGFISDFKKNIDSIFSFHYEFEDEEYSFKKKIIDSTDENIRSSITQIAYLKFEINVDESDVHIEYDSSDPENVKITKITVDTRHIVVMKNLYEFLDFLKETFMCECELRC